VETCDEDGEAEPQARQGGDAEPSGTLIGKVDSDGGDEAEEGDCDAGNDAAHGSVGADVVVCGQDEPVKRLFEHLASLVGDGLEHDGVWVGGRELGGVEGGEDVRGNVELIVSVGGKEGLFGAKVKEGEVCRGLGGGGEAVVVFGIGAGLGL